jgi:hypothetical protein
MRELLVSRGGELVTNRGDDGMASLIVRPYHLHTARLCWAHITRIKQGGIPTINKIAADRTSKYFISENRLTWSCIHTQWQQRGSSFDAEGPHFFQTDTHQPLERFGPPFWLHGNH